MMLSGVIGSHSLGTTSATLPLIAAHWSVPSIGRILPPRFALSLQSFTPARLQMVGSVRKNGKDIAETGKFANESQRYPGAYTSRPRGRCAGTSPRGARLGGSRR